MTKGQIALLAGFTALAPMAIDMYLPALTPLAADLNVSVEQAGASVSVFLMGIAGGQLIAGPLSDRLGRKPLFLGGLIMFAVSALVAAVTSSFTVLLAARLIQALGACSAMVSARAVVRDRFDATESAKFFSLLALVGGMAPVLAPLIGAGLILVGDWRSIFWVMAGFATLLFLGGLTVLPETRSTQTAAQARGENPFAAYWALLTDRGVIGYLLAAMFNSAAFFTYVANSSVVLVDSYGFSPSEFGVIFGVNSLALVGGAQLNRMLLKRRGPDALLGLSARNALILAALLLAFAATEAGGIWVLMALLFFMVGSIASVQANTMAGALAHAELRAGSCAALIGAATFSGGAAASWIAGLLYDGTARGLAAVVAASLLGVAFSVWLVIRPKASQPA